MATVNQLNAATGLLQTANNQGMQQYAPGITSQSGLLQQSVYSNSVQVPYQIYNQPNVASPWLQNSGITIGNTTTPVRVFLGLLPQEVIDTLELEPMKEGYPFGMVPYFTGSMGTAESKVNIYLLTDVLLALTTNIGDLKIKHHPLFDMLKEHCEE